MAKPPKAFESAFNTYSVSEVIGEGGSGRVFAVKDSDGRTLALKCLFPDRVNTEKRKRFKNEIDFCHKYQHPNVIQVIDSGLTEWDGKKCPFYVMPFYPLTLRTLIDKGLSPDGVLPLFSQMLDGVEAAHLRGVVHRDIKPENVLCNENTSSLVVADFGIAHFEEDLIATVVDTTPAAKLANLRYSAPEQRMKGGTVDRLADIFALGLILNEMFTRSVPQGTGYATIAGVASQFSYLDSLVEKMIQNNPKARFSSIEEIKKELIGRRNDFVALQELDAKRGEVAPTFAPSLVEPIRLVAVDWVNEQLIFQLNRTPERGWVQRFKDPRGSWSSILGAEPPRFDFNGDTATIGADERSAQDILNRFKEYIEMANRSYNEDLETRARRQELDYRARLEEEVREAERRARVRQNLKI